MSYSMDSLTGSIEVAGWGDGAGVGGAGSCHSAQALTLRPPSPALQFDAARPSGRPTTSKVSCAAAQHGLPRLHAHRVLAHP